MSKYYKSTNGQPVLFPDSYVGYIPNSYSEITEQEYSALLNMTPNLEEEKGKKLVAMSAYCNSEIIAGCDVILSDGTTHHFALQETDQINLSTAMAAVGQGAAGYPYHSDGELCSVFSAADIQRIAQAATAHKLYHTTYCNHLFAWIKRATTADELAGITYGAELPEDLAANLEAVLAAAGAGSNG